MMEMLEAMDRRDEAATERLQFIAGYKTQLAERTKRVTDADKRIHEIREEMKGPGQSDRPLLAAIAAAGGNGRADHPEEGIARAQGTLERAEQAAIARRQEETADERQRGVTQVEGKRQKEEGKTWAVHKWDAKSKGKRGSRLGTVYASTEEEAQKAAEVKFNPTGRLPLRVIIGDEIIPGSAQPWSGSGILKPDGKPRKPQTDRADRREVVISPDGPNRQVTESLCDLQGGPAAGAGGKGLTYDPAHRSAGPAAAQRKTPAGGRSRRGLDGRTG
jgi:hypothetical protein